MQLQKMGKLLLSAVAYRTWLLILPRMVPESSSMMVFKPRLNTYLFHLADNNKQCWQYQTCDATDCEVTELTAEQKIELCILLLLLSLSLLLNHKIEKKIHQKFIFTVFYATAW